MKILSDFDGVWTEQAEEAEAIFGVFAERLALLRAMARERVEAELRAFLAEVGEQPERYGWAPDGRITAYVDEDPLLRTSALAMYLAAQSGREAVRPYFDAIARAGFESPMAFAGECFVDALSRFRAAHAALLVKGAREVLLELRELGAEVVVVSNSPPEKIEAWFAAAGVATRGREALLRVRGNAAKWRLGGVRAIERGGRVVFVDRPAYRVLLEEERPDAVIGDVYSLDLALPGVMREDEPELAPRLLLLRRHAHTPQWVLADRAGGHIDQIVGGVAELVPLALAARAARHSRR